MNGRTPQDTAIAARLQGVVEEYALADRTTEYFVPPSMRRRRGFDAVESGDLATLSLIRDQDILRWHYEPPTPPTQGRRRRRAAARPIGADVLTDIPVREIGANQITQALEELDAKLTPNQGLRRLVDGRLQPVKDVKAKGRVLLLVHGTFSKSDMFVDELAQTPEGKALLAQASAKYDAVLAFDHPTLCVSPWLNAIDLEEALAGVSGTIDVVAHSRGGLVVGWWLRNASRKAGNVVFVGSPLQGTSLASPARLRAALDMLANVFTGLDRAGAAASTVVPLMVAVTGISKIVGGTLMLGARLPFADAGVALVPGLASQSRVVNNQELLRLGRAGWASSDATYHAVMSNFVPEPSTAPLWQFWKHFRSWGMMAADSAVDAIFEGPNDLVVDDDSMATVCDKAIARGSVLDFGDSDTVHHCNYFRQARTAVFLRKCLQI